MRPARVALAGLAAILLSAAVRALLHEEPETPAPPPPSLDADGDPLPAWALCRIGTKRFRGAEHAVAFVDAGRALVHATHDGFIRRIDRDTGAVLGEFLGHAGDYQPRPARNLLDRLGRAFDPSQRRRPDQLYAVAFSLDGARVVVRGSRRTWLRDLATGATVSIWRNEISGDLAFSADGSRLVEGGDDAQLQVRDGRTGARILSLEGDAPESRGWSGRDSAALSPDGALAAVQTYRLRVVDVATAKKVFGTKPGDFAGPCAFSPDGRLFVHPANRTGFVVRATADWSEVRRIEQQANAVAFSPGSDRVLVAGASVVLADARDPAKDRTIDLGAGWCNAAAWAQDGASAAVIRGSAVRLVDAASAAESPKAVPLTGPIQAMAWSPDGRRLAIGDGESVRVVEATTGAATSAFRREGRWLTWIRWSPDGGRLAVAMAHPDQVVRIVDATTGARLGETPLLAAESERFDAFSETPRGLVSGAPLRLVSVRDGRVLVEFATSIDEPFAVADAANSLVLAGSWNEDRWQAFDLRSGRRVAEISHPRGVAYWEACGGLLLVWDHGSRIAVYDARTGARRLEFAAPDVISGPVTLAPGGGLIAAFDETHAIHLFDGASGEARGVLRGHRGNPQAWAFSPDGRRLAVASEEGTILVWDAAAAAGR